MAISTYTDWDIRTTGAATNGAGFYDLNPGTSIDYSQQDTAQLALTDIASNGAGTGISSVTGGFTAAMEGNCMYIAGTGFTTGWYQITGYTDTNNITIDRSCGASATGGTGNVGGAWTWNSTNQTTFFNSTNKSNYNICHWEKGTYTITSQLNNTVNYQTWKGYDAAHGDRPTGTNRPLLQSSTNAVVVWNGAYAEPKNMRFDCSYGVSGSTTFTVSGAAPRVEACSFKRTNYTGAYAASFTGDWGIITACEFEATLGNALGIGGTAYKVHYCWLHDSTQGINYTNNDAFGMTVTHCIVSNMSSNGMRLYYASQVLNCVLYDCATGVNFTSSYASVLNSIIHTCTTGIYAASSPVLVELQGNCYYNNTLDYTSGMIPGDTDIFTNPLMVDPANDDFTLDASSPCFNTGIGLKEIFG